MTLVIPTFVVTALSVVWIVVKAAILVTAVLGVYAMHAISKGGWR